MNPDMPLEAEEDSMSTESVGAVDSVKAEAKEGDDSEEKMDEEEEQVVQPKKRRIRRPNKLLEDLKSQCSIKTLLMYNSGRRITKKTKYDPSEYFLTPLVRKKRAAGAPLPPEVPKVKLKRGRPPYKKIGALAVEGGKDVCGLNTKKVSRSMWSVDQSVATSKSKSKSKSERPFQLVVQPIPLAGVTCTSASSIKDQCYICCSYACVRSTQTLACSLCLNIAHEGCVKGDQFYKDLKKWRCSECLISNPAICSTCDNEYNKTDGVMLMCDYCEEMFHAECHTPPVPVSEITSSSPWRCYLCPKLSITETLIGGREDLKSSIGTFAFSSSTTKSLVVDSYSTKLPSSSSQLDSTTPHSINQLSSSTRTFNDTVIKTEPPDDYEEQTQNSQSQVKQPQDDRDQQPPKYKFHRPNEPIPNVDDWTSKQVADYFAERFGAIVGNAFLVQEIDGKSLKLMSRSDVTDQLGLHFGIALKVLYYVRKIQLNTNIIHKLWS